MKLGQFLLDHKKLIAAQVDEALQCQVAFGGRLGTNLVELGYVTVAELAQYLSAQIGVPFAEDGWLAKAEPRALQAIPRAFVERCRVLPLKLEERVIHVAMVDPLNTAQLDELRFASNRRVVAYVLPELRMHFWMEHYYGLARERRYVELDGEMRGRFVGRTPATEKPAAAGPRPVVEVDLGVVQPLQPGQDLLDEATFQKTYQRPIEDGAPPLEQLEAHELTERTELTAPPEPPPRAPKQLVELEASLARAHDREEIIDAALQIAALLTRAAAIFVVHPGSISGIRGVGGRLERSAMESIMLHPAAASAIATSAATAKPHRGKIGDYEADLRVLRAMGRGDVSEVALIPVKIRDRVVNLFYADNGKDRIAETAYAGLLALTELISGAYERLILERKRAP